MSEPLLRVRDLTVLPRPRCAPVLDRISFDLHAGESIGILGKSGAGKSTLARALLCLLPARNWLVSGRVQFDGRELLNLSEKQLARFRGRRIALVTQEPELALNPVLRAGRQVEEVLKAHFAMSQRERERHAREMLSAVGLEDERFYSAPVHELSGGQRQRVVLAQCLSARPALLIADEPTSALDTVTQSEILDLLCRLKSRMQLALLFITHNPALLTRFTSRALVISGGRASEMNLHESTASVGL